MSDTLDLLLRRRSVPAAFLGAPGPDAAQIEQILTAAARVPDHGKLAPWRFILVEGEARGRLAAKLSGLALREPGADARKITEKSKAFEAPLTVVVVSRAGPHVKIPEWEQVLSAGAVCMNLIVAAHALGFAANWLTGRAAYDRESGEVLGLAEGERVAGFIHIGSAASVPSDRDRPSLSDVVTRWEG